MLAVKELSEEEKQQVMMTEDYQRFLDRSSRVMERALTQDIDIFVDYTGEHQEGERYVSLLSLMSGQRMEISCSYKMYACGFLVITALARS